MSRIGDLVYDRLKILKHSPLAYRLGKVTPSRGSQNGSASFEKNKGRISYTHKDSGTYGRFINACRLDAWKHALETHPIDRETIVDVGCSYGSWADNWRGLGFKRLHGLDGNPAVIEPAREVFDRVELGFSDRLPEVYPENRTVAANGVLIHILEPKMNVAFMRDIAQTLTPDGHFLFAAVDARHYGLPKVEWYGPDSCKRHIERFRGFAKEAGLKIVDEVGTFIEPWALQDLEFVAKDQRLRDDEALYEAMRELSTALRGTPQAPFSERLFITRRRD